ncbi:MAG TPA: GDP-mannose 4,6-dehydratase [Oligoflexia bacterium]|nr:GDP-mannose 4,6-dehydratase [Oligoflexia bacterium]HMP47103.1 GDP-mannose 4,6-dehydratase [Oligoflexia bacterium]
MKRILITGAAGFIGSHLAGALLDSGYELLAVDNLSTGSIKNIKEFSDNSRFHFLEADVQSEKLASELSLYQPEQVVHLAGQMNVRKSVEDPLFDALQNIMATLFLLEKCDRVNCRRFVFSSTGGAIYGEQEVFPAAENHKVMPECPYGVSKRCAELYLEYYATKKDFGITSLRFGNVYGPRQNPKGEAGVVSIFISQLNSGLSLSINGDGTQTRDFIYVSDIVRAIELVLNSGQDGYRCFNLGTGIETSVISIAEHLRDIAVESDSSRKVYFDYRPKASGEQIRSLLDAGSFSKEFKWKPLVSLRDGLIRTFLYKV